MNQDNPNQDFADSAKNATNDKAFFGNVALNDATREMLTILNTDAPKQGPVKPELAKVLRTIQAKQLFAGEHDENGRQVFKSFDHYMKRFRRIYVAQAGGHKGDRYKHVSNALLYLRLEDADLPVLPQRPSVLQKLSTVEPALQVDVWALTVKEANGEEITPLKVAASAHALGDTEVKFPPLTPSSEKPKLREAWKAFKENVTAEFGPSIQRHFPLIDVFIEKKGTVVTLAPTSAQGTPGIAVLNGPSQNATNVLAETIQNPGVGGEGGENHTLGHTFKLPDLGESLASLSSLPRPFVTSQGGYAFIAFEGKSQLVQFVREGFPHPDGENRDGLYKFESKLAGGIWKLKKALSGQDLYDEVDRVAEHLEAAALKLKSTVSAA